MTKKLFISLILSFSLLILSNVESKGQCSSCLSGMTPASFVFTLSTGCQITVNYCWKCPTPPHLPGAATLCNISIPSGNCIGIVIDVTFFKNF